MQTDELVERLISAKNNSQVKSLLKENSDLANDDLAAALKEICYEAWTKEPAIARKTANALNVIARVSPTEKTKGFASWINGIALITEGKIEAAVKKLDLAANTFKKVRNKHLAAQTKVAKLYCFALLGRYDEALKNGRDALRTFEKYDDQLAAGRVENNIGNIYWRREMHHKAEEYFLSARRRFLKINDTVQLAMIENCLATSYTYQNNFREAEKFYKKALSKTQKDGMLVTEAEIEASLGNLSLFRARYDQALKFLELSLRKYETLDMPHHMTVAELEMADIYLELNLATEAFEIYERVIDSLSHLKMQGELARARSGLAQTAILLGKKELATRELEHSARLYRAEKNLTGAAYVKLIETKLALSVGHAKKAQGLIRDAERMLVKSGDMRYALLSGYLNGEVLSALGRYEMAEHVLLKVYSQAMKQENPFIAQAAQTSLGTIALRQSDLKASEKYFRNSIDLIESLRDPLPAEEFRMSFFADKLSPYQELAKIYLSRSEVDKALALVESSRSRTLSETAVSGSLKTKRSGASAALYREMADLREEINWFYNRVQRGSQEESKPLLAEAKKREKKITELARRIDNTDGSNRRTKKHFDLRLLQKKLGADRVLIEYVEFDEQIGVFIVSRESIDFFPDLANSTEIAELVENMRFQFETMRAGGEVLAGFLDELRKRSDLYLQKLYEKLLGKIEHLIDGRHLVVAPFGKLHCVPFHALFDGERYVIEKGEVSYSPSAAVLQHCLCRSVGKFRNAFLLGFADEKIPHVEREIKDLQKIFADNLTLSGEQANKANLKRGIADYDVVHFACHGQFRGDNPMFSSLILADGPLNAKDIAELRLRPGLVTLSACETGLNAVADGDELLGLTRGFLSAGAVSFVTTLWTVNDKAARKLTTEFYKYLKNGHSAAESLRKAQRSFIDRREPPYLWSPFFLTGRW